MYVYVLTMSVCEPERVVARRFPTSVCLHLSELLLGVLHTQVSMCFVSLWCVCLFAYIFLHVSLSSPHSV